MWTLLVCLAALRCHGSAIDDIVGSAVDDVYRHLSEIEPKKGPNLLKGNKAPLTQLKLKGNKAPLTQLKGSRGKRLTNGGVGGDADDDDDSDDDTSASNMRKFQDGVASAEMQKFLRLKNNRERAHGIITAANVSDETGVALALSKLTSNETAVKAAIRGKKLVLAAFPAHARSMLFSFDNETQQFGGVGPLLWDWLAGQAGFEYEIVLLPEVGGSWDVTYEYYMQLRQDAPVGATAEAPAVKAVGNVSAMAVGNLSATSLESASKLPEPPHAYDFMYNLVTINPEDVRYVSASMPVTRYGLLLVTLLDDVSQSMTGAWFDRMLSIYRPFSLKVWPAPYDACHALVIRL